MAAVVADAEWLEPDERDAVQQLLRNEYTAEPPPPPQPLQQQPQQERWQQDAARRGGSKPAELAGSDARTPQQPKGPSSASPARAAASQLPSEPQASDQRAADSPGSDDASDERRLQEAVLAEAAAQMAAAQRGSGAGANTVPPGVPTETFRMLRWATVSESLFSAAHALCAIS